MKSFKDSQQLTSIDFNLKNQGILISLLYGLLVVPRELWEPNGVSTNFEFCTRTHFKFIHPHYVTTADFLRLMRNSLAHANFDIVVEDSRYKFWNVTPKGVRNFEVEITHGYLGEFVGEIGKYFINQVRPFNNDT